jgi:hypothetical protein
MNSKKILGGATIVAAAATLSMAPAAVAGGTVPRVSVRVEGAKKTLLRATQVRPKRGWITRYGAPKGRCPSASGQGALQLATQGRWKGSWSSSYDEYFITRILGQTESGVKNYWELFVNNVAASTGACEIKLHRGEKLLFAAVPSTGAPEYPTRISAPRTATAGQPFTVHVVLYNAKGKPHALKGATVRGAGVTVTTNAKGNATIKTTRTGRRVFTASKAGEIRSETRVRVAS